MKKKILLAGAFLLLLLLLSLAVGCSDKNRLLITADGPENSRILAPFVSHFGILLGEWWEKSDIEGNWVVRIVENKTSSRLSIYVRTGGGEEFFILHLLPPSQMEIPYVAAKVAGQTARFILELVGREEKPKALFINRNRGMEISGFFVFKRDFS